MGFDNFNFMF